MVKQVKIKESFGREKKQRQKKSRGKFTKNISSFLSKIEEDYEHETSHTLIPKIHKLISKYKQKLFFDCRKIAQKIKICQICDKWDNLKDFIECTICEDYFHSECLSKKNIKFGEHFACSSCKNNDYHVDKCYRCKNLLKQAKVTCKKCNQQYDEKCFSFQKNKCKICTKIEHFERSEDKKNLKKKNNKKQRLSIGLTSPQRGLLSKFCFKSLPLSLQETLKYKKSLLAAIEHKNMLYTEHLIIPESYLGNIYNTSLDFGIEEMNQHELQAFERYKSHPIGPFLLENTKEKGFDVIADKQIHERSIICQYIGEVISLRQCVHLQVNDSSMQLLRGVNSHETLIIRPKKFTNMARFINGVIDKRKANVESMRIIYKGRVVVLLVAKRSIQKGESLCYDYNAGNIKAKYDTSYFIQS